MTDLTSHDEHLTALGQHIDDDTAPLPERPLPNFLRFMPPFIHDLHRRGVEITLDPKNFELFLSGFYGNGPMRLIYEEKENRFVAVDKNDKRVIVADFSDLVLLNFDWWSQANTRGKYQAPERPWLDGFRDKNLVKRSVIYVKNDNPNGTTAE
jgi:hypothetical protein